MSKTKTTLRPARDWRKLAREARDGGYVRISSVAQFIADNTTDARADDFNRRGMFAPGYIAGIEDWLMRERL